MRLFLLLLPALTLVSSFAQEPNNLGTAPATCYASLTVEVISTTTCDAAIAVADELDRARMASAMATRHARSSQFARAEELIEVALASQPNDPVVLINLGSMRINQERFDEAVDAYLHAQDILETSGAAPEPVLFLNRSLALRALGRYADAKRDYDHFVWLRDSLRGDSSLYIDE